MENNKTKPVTMKLAFNIVNESSKGVNEPNEESAILLLDKLQKEEIAKILNLNVTMKRSVINPEAKGIMTVGRIQSFDLDDEIVDVIFFGKDGIAAAETITDTDFVVNIGVRFNYSSNEAMNITRFYITTKE